MNRALEYMYLVGALVIGTYMAIKFDTLPLPNKVFLSLAMIVFAFMFSFRRKQRQILEDIDRRKADGEDADPDEEDQNPSEQ
ncbi:MAG: hypothetical protein U0176_00700 [Bacteroidia bacterium]